jgi:glycosyltransferase involved in cell wall biosynthesis
MSVHVLLDAEAQLKSRAGSKARSLRIAIDAITPGASLDSRAGGMRMYLTTLTAKMSEQEPTVEFVVLESRQFPLGELDGIPNVTRVVCPGVPGSRAGRVIYQNSALPIYLRGLHADALLATCNVLPLGCPLPSVVVVQSLQYFDHPEAYGRFRGAYLRVALRHAVRHAQSLICVSETARDELIRLTGVNSSQVSVIHHGISPAITGHAREMAPASPPYILCVATLYRYKNLERLLEAFAMLKTEREIPHRLKIIGGEADVSIAELSVIAEKLGVADQVDFTGPLPHDRLPAEYGRASVFIYPSLAETFGLPPLEAMAMGVPVVASKAGPIPEIVGEAAELVDPLDVRDIARGLGRVLLDPLRSQALIRLGLKRSSEFSWDESARLTFAAIHSVTRTKPVAR